jgi:hypothetical protein
VIYYILVSKHRVTINFFTKKGSVKIMESYMERFLGLSKLAAIYAYCVELAAINDFFLWCGHEYHYDTDGHSLVRALYLCGLVDESLWHDWNHGSYLFYKNPGVPDPNHFDMALAAGRLFKQFEYAAQYTDQYAQHIIL